MVDIRGSLETRVHEVTASDGVHPNNVGHRIIAETVLKTLESIDPHLGVMK